MYRLTLKLRGGDGSAAVTTAANTAASVVAIVVCRIGFDELCRAFTESIERWLSGSGNG